jgi:hypothetical protein
MAAPSRRKLTSEECGTAVLVVFQSALTAWIGQMLSGKTWKCKRQGRRMMWMISDLVTVVQYLTNYKNVIM